MNSVRFIILLFCIVIPGSVSRAQPALSRPPPVRPLPPLSTSVRVKGLPAARTAVPLSRDRRVFYDLSQETWITQAPGVRRKIVAGETVTFSLLELKPGVLLRHGTRVLPYERVLLQINGALQMDVDGRPISLDPMQVTVIPPGVPHAMTGTSGDGPVIVLEFSSARWTDLDSIASPVQRTVTELNRKPVQIVDFNQRMWTLRPNGVQFKRVEGDSCYFHLWYFPPSSMKGADRPGHHHTAEQISVVLRGHAEMRIGDRVQTVGPGALLMIPADVDHLPMTPIRDEEILLLDYQPIIRPVILTPAGKRIMDGRQ